MEQKIQGLQEIQGIQRNTSGKRRAEKSQELSEESREREKRSKTEDSVERFKIGLLPDVELDDEFAEALVKVASLLGVFSEIAGFISAGNPKLDIPLPHKMRITDAILNSEGTPHAEVTGPGCGHIEQAHINLQNIQRLHHYIKFSKPEILLVTGPLHNLFLAFVLHKLENQDEVFAPNTDLVASFSANFRWFQDWLAVHHPIFEGRYTMANVNDHLHAPDNDQRKKGVSENEIAQRQRDREALAGIANCFFQNFSRVYPIEGHPTISEHMGPTGTQFREEHYSRAIKVAQNSLFKNKAFVKSILEQNNSVRGSQAKKMVDAAKREGENPLLLQTLKQHMTGIPEAASDEEIFTQFISGEGVLANTALLEGIRSVQIKKIVIAAEQSGKLPLLLEILKQNMKDVPEGTSDEEILKQFTSGKSTIGYDKLLEKIEKAGIYQISLSDKATNIHERTSKATPAALIVDTIATLVAIELAAQKQGISPQELYRRFAPDLAEADLPDTFVALKFCQPKKFVGFQAYTRVDNPQPGSSLIYYGKTETREDALQLMKVLDLFLARGVERLANVYNTVYPNQPAQAAEAAEEKSDQPMQVEEDITAMVDEQEPAEQKEEPEAWLINALKKLPIPGIYEPSVAKNEQQEDDAASIARSLSRMLMPPPNPNIPASQPALVPPSENAAVTSTPTPALKPMNMGD
ncbi:MAG: hypothetical protein K0Q74_1225 [Gammaproteobacteria bacterium]|nr:hypothetical protein [Gammaproteobacteria bacterium]